MDDFNPATEFPMLSDFFDIDGNLYGFDSSFNDPDFNDDPFDNSFNSDDSDSFSGFDFDDDF